MDAETGGHRRLEDNAQCGLEAMSATAGLAFATIEIGAIDVLQKLNRSEGQMHTDDQLCSHL